MINFQEKLIGITASFLIFSLSSAAFAGSDGDKGTIGIVCRNLEGETFEVPVETRTSDDLEAQKKFEGCVAEVMHRWTNNQITVNVLKLDEKGNASDGGVNPGIMIQGYTTYRNVLEQVKAERAKQKEKSGVKPGANGIDPKAKTNKTK